MQDHTYHLPFPDTRLMTCAFTPLHRGPGDADQVDREQKDLV